RSDVPERTMIVREVAGVEHLDTRIVLTVEGGNGGGATSGLSSFRRSEPETEVVHLDRIEGRIRGGIGEGSVEDGRRGSGAGSDGEGFDIEAADEAAKALAILVRLDVALMPGHAKGRFGNLQDEEVEFGLGRQTRNGDLHDFHGTNRG